ncbi:MAG: hypothetical protein AAB880_00520 [Patescibacteria group bacterium]
MTTRIFISIAIAMLFIGFPEVNPIFADTESASWAEIKSQAIDDLVPAEKLVVTKNKAGGLAEWAVDTYVFYDDGVNPHAPVSTSVDREKGEYKIAIRLPRPHRPGMELVMHGVTGWNNTSSDQWATVVAAHLFAKVQGDGRTITFTGKWNEFASDDLAALLAFGAHADPLRRAAIEIVAVHRN